MASSVRAQSRVSLTHQALAAIVTMSLVLGLALGWFLSSGQRAEGAALVRSDQTNHGEETSQPRGEKPQPHLERNSSVQARPTQSPDHLVPVDEPTNHEPSSAAKQSGVTLRVRVVDQDGNAVRSGVSVYGRLKRPNEEDREIGNLKDQDFLEAQIEPGSWEFTGLARSNGSPVGGRTPWTTLEVPADNGVPCEITLAFPAQTALRPSVAEVFY